MPRVFRAAEKFRRRAARRRTRRACFLSFEEMLMVTRRLAPFSARGIALSLALMTMLVLGLLPVADSRALQTPAADNVARMRIVHGIADAGPLDVYLDGGLALIGIVYGETSASLNLAGGKHDFAVVPTGTAPGAAIAAGTVTVTAGAAYYTPLLGSAENTSVGLFRIDEQPLPQGRSRFRVINGVADSERVVPVFTGGDALSEPLSFGDVSAYAAVDAGTYDLDILDEASGDSLIALPQTPFVEGAATDIVLIGQNADGSLRALVESSPVEVERATGLTAQIVAGACNALQATVLELGVVRPGQGEAVGSGSTAQVAQGYTLASSPFATLVASPHALVVSDGALSSQTIVACGEIAGTLNDAGSLAVALRGASAGAANGIAVFAPGVADPETTGVSVFLTTGGSGEPPAATPAAG
jgi:hypothetical protein